MDLEESITVTKLDIQNGRCYLMIGWQTDSFEMYLYTKDQLWKGRFSSSRLAGFSRNLQMTEKAYFANLKRCLSQQRNDYRYELKSGFFYWKRKLKDAVVMEGFLPVEVDTSPKNAQPDLVEVLIAVNRHLKDKIHSVRKKFKTIKTDYQKCLKDTEEFLNLKIEMEKALCDKFLNLINIQQSQMKELDQVHKLQLENKEMGK